MLRPSAANFKSRFSVTGEINAVRILLNRLFPKPPTVEASPRLEVFLAKIPISCRIKYIDWLPNSTFSHVKLVSCCAH